MGELTHSTTELARAALRFSWSLPLFGAQQLVNMVAPLKAAQAMNNVSAAMEENLRGWLHTAFTTGVGLQVDLLGGLVASSAQTDASTAKEPPAGGWGPMPYNVVVPQKQAPLSIQPLPISADYPFERNYLDVFGSKMHYIDVGSGDPILMLHGNPTWSYIWRNIIPYLQPLGRCIAPDLIGYGRSDKPDINYRWQDQVRYLEHFIEKMNLRNITLVLHDQGSGLGFHYAMRHQNNVKAIAFFESIIRPYPWNSFSTPEFREIFRKFRSGGVGGEGWQMLVENNMFIEQLLPQAAGRQLTETEMNYYREPFIKKESRLPVWQFPRETPIGGEPPDVWQAVSTYSQRLQQSPIPKLLLYAEPGALVTAEHLEWARQRIRNLKTVYVGSGSHFIQESSPHEIGREIAAWITDLRMRR